MEPGEEGAGKIQNKFKTMLSIKCKLTLESKKHLQHFSATQCIHYLLSLLVQTVDSNYLLLLLVLFSSLD